MGDCVSEMETMGFGFCVCAVGWWLVKVVCERKVCCLMKEEAGCKIDEDQRAMVRAVRE